VPRFLLVGALGVFSLLAEDRTFESVVESLAYGGGCSTSVTLRNLSDRRVAVEFEGHRGSGALAPILNLSGNRVSLEPHARAEYKLDIDEETDEAWVRLRERIPTVEQSPVVAISASIECVAGNQIRSVKRDVVFPMRNPWFSGDVGEMPGNVVSLVNASEAPVRVIGCYSSGGLYSVGGGELQPICNDAIEAQVPPFGSRRYSVSHKGNTHFSLKVQGSSVVLEMMRASTESRRNYTVDSSIKFGEEAGGK
jgi:hypothetical protein